MSPASPNPANVLHTDPVAPSVTPSSRRTGAETRSLIVGAAEHVVIRDGIGHLTLEAAAAEAGLSKGGVLYHFPTRDALVSAMVTSMLDRFEQEIANHLPPEGTPEAAAPGTYARAYLAASLAATEPGEEQVGVALLAAAAAEPALMEPLHEAAAGWQARLEADGLDTGQATALRLACDGLWLCDLFGLAPPGEALRQRVGQFLAGLTTGQP